MHYYKDLGNGHYMEIVGGEIPADAIGREEPIVSTPPFTPIQHPYIPTDAELLAQAKQPKLWQIESQLAALDRYLPRALEDFWTTIGFDATTLPQVQQERMAQKAALREKYAAVQAAATVAEVEAVEV